MGKLVQAIVRGPENYFDGQLFAPGQIVTVDEDLVSDEDEIEKEITVQLPQPVVNAKGDLVTEAKKTVKVRTRFRPVDSAPRAKQPTTTAEVATGQLDRLNVSDFIKGSGDDIAASIAAGNVDDFLGAIEQAELARKGPARSAVKEAVAARLAALNR